MKNKITNLKDLLIEEGRDLYSSTQQELKELPKLENSINSPKLKELIKKQIKVSQDQQKNLKDAFHQLNSTFEAGICRTTESILNRTHDIIKHSTEKEVSDAGIINSLQQLSHRKIAGFGSSAAYAKQIGQKEAAKAFHAALEHEKEIDAQLSELAVGEINYKAAAVMM